MDENAEPIEFEGYESVTTEEGEESRSDESEKYESTLLITKQLIKEVQQELCLVKLCWPEVDVRKDLYLRTLPSSYHTVSGKEKVLAWYAENFRCQFRTKYPDRKPLLLACENECGIQKFVSTTIRRSTLPYPELYTWQGCGKFVSDYIEYEPLDKPLDMPKHLRSPTWVQKFQKGNCFECATFLTSLLLGRGYNAFVVSGYASREQTLGDLTRTTSPYLPQPEKHAPATLQTEQLCRYELKLPTAYDSEFLLKLEQEEEQKLQEKLRLEEEEQRRLIEVISL